jgi:peptidoglycan/LPS O-acetylase OafA/YrhL
VRAVAVLAVLAGHASIPRTEGGATGVEAFFVLSGFLITALLLEEHATTGRVSLRLFYARRALRLFPALAAVIAFGVAAALVARAVAATPPYYVHDTLHGAPSVVFYFSNWVRAFGTHLGLFDHMWSLSVEEQFYLVWPVVLVLVVRRWDPRRLFAVAAVGAAASLAIRGALWDGPSSVDRIHNGSDTRAFAVLLGCALAVAVLTAGPAARRRLATGARVLVVPASLFLAAAVPLQRGDADLIASAVLPLGGLASLVVIAHVVSDPTGLMGRVLAWRPLVVIGRVSYGLYVWHLPLFQLVVAHGPTAQPLRGMLQFSLLAVVAALSYRFIEQPALRLKDRLRRVSVPAPGSAAPLAPPANPPVESVP